MSIQLHLESLSNEVGLKLFFNWFNTKEINQFLSENDIPNNFGIMLLVHISIQKQCKILTLVGLLKEDNLTYQEVSDLILKCIELDMIDYFKDTKQIHCKLFPPKELYDELQNLVYPLPLLDKPKQILFNNQSGYHSYNNHIILGNKINRHSEDICLDHINRMNNIKLSLNMNVIANCKNYWKKKKKKKEDFITRTNKEKQLILFMRHVEDVYKTLIMNQDYYYLCHRYDKRGRVYCTGYAVNYMGNQYQKAVVEFYKKELINGN